MKNSIRSRVVSFPARPRRIVESASYFLPVSLSPWWNGDAKHPSIALQHSSTVATLSARLMTSRRSRSSLPGIFGLCCRYRCQTASTGSGSAA